MEFQILLLYIVLTLINSISPLYNQLILISPATTEDDQRMIETCLVLLKMSFFLYEEYAFLL